MADSEISVKVVADLSDIKKSLDAIQKSTGTLNQVAGQDIDNVVGKLFVLKAGFDTVKSVMFGVAETLKTVAVDMAVLGERATQVENGFMRLSEQAGISGETLKSAIEKAADGTIETTHLLQRSSELVVAFGKEATRIPEIIELSRKVARNFGLDAEEAFNKVSEAVRNGNTRSLKQYGILVETEQAIKKYAEAHGVASNSLNETGRAQAILNAVLEKGNKAFADTSLKTGNVIDSVSRLKNAWDDLIESFGKAANTQGSFISTTLSGATAIIKELSLAIGAGVGGAAEQAAIKTQLLEARLSMLYSTLGDIQKNDQGFFSKYLFGDSAASVQAEIDMVQKKIDAIKQKQGVNYGEQFGPAAPGSNKSSEEDITNKQALLNNERKFKSDIAALRQQSAQNAMALSITNEQFEAAAQEKRISLQDQYLAKVQETNANELLTSQQKYEMLEQQRLMYAQNQLLLDQQLEQEKTAQMERELAQSTSFGDQMALSAELNARRSSDAWKRSGSLGGAAVNAFSQQGIKALDAFGRGSLSASEAVKAAFFGALGQMASAKGQVMLLESIYPPNPAGMAAGAGLIALGGLLSSMGGGGGSSLGGGGGGAGGAGPEGGFGGPSISDAKQSSKSVTVNVEGNYYDSEQSKLAIVEAVRSVSDANDYTIQRGNRK